MLFDGIDQCTSLRFVSINRGMRFDVLHVSSSDITLEIYFRRAIRSKSSILQINRPYIQSPDVQDHSLQLKKNNTDQIKHLPKNAWTWQKNWLTMKAYTTENHLQIHKKQWINLNDWSACSSRVSSGCYLKITPWIHHSKSFPVQREEYTEYLLSFGADKVQSKPEHKYNHKNTILFCFSPCAHQGYP